MLLACVTAGGVSFTNDTAVFDGTGSIQCAMPSLQEIVYDMTNGRYTPQTSCNCKGNPTILADVQLTPNTTGSDWENPLVHRALGTSTDMALAATVPAYSTIPQAFMQLNVVGNLAQSNPFIANHMPNSLAASYVKVIAGMQPAFLANGADPGTGTPPASGLAVSNAATTLTIGYSPISGQSLHGVLHSLNVDPGCYGTG
ncbi:MAG: hypothetical protein H6660_15400 [Ardenticatenaceae bacterium]|nr:hypothetical protein [Ardenticatenaceae bacterium]